VPVLLFHFYSTQNLAHDVPAKKESTKVLETTTKPGRKLITYATQYYNYWEQYT